MQNVDTLEKEIKKEFLENGVTDDLNIKTHAFIAQANKLLEQIESEIGYQPIDELADPVIRRNKIKAEKKKVEFQKLKESSNWLRKFEDV